jgi:hypothetical protein
MINLVEGLSKHWRETTMAGNHMVEWKNTSNNM